MASNFENPSLWRLSTPGGTPYKFIDIEGEFESDDANVKWTVLVESASLLTFMAEVFPPPLVFGDVRIHQNMRLPGSNLLATRASFRKFTEGLPVDPFQIDTSPPDGTYQPVVQVEIQFEPYQGVEPDPEDPTTFLEISSTSNFEFLHIPSEQTIVEAEDPLEQEVVKTPLLPITIQIPLVEWTVRWPQLQFDFYWSVVAPRLRSIAGGVNSGPVPFLGITVPETLALVGWTYRQQTTWKPDTGVDIPFITLEMKFLERMGEFRGQTFGWNHHYVPEVGGFVRLLLPDGSPTYLPVDTNILFQVS